MKKFYIFLIGTFTAFTAFSQTPAVLKDINPGSSSSRAGNLIKVGNVVFFAADDGAHGSELWKTDGTVAGTVLVKDIRSGASGAGTELLSLRLNMNGTLYFSADDGINGVELWKSDGTEAGTVLVKDINPGSPGSYPGIIWQAGQAVNGSFYFEANVAGIGFELWKSDGTAGGTVLVKDINPASVFSDSHPSYFIYINGVVFFQAFDGTHGTELWKSDGTGPGTVMVKDIKPGAGSAFTLSSRDMVGFNNTLYFAGDDGINGNELWTSDGTEAGTVMFKDIEAGAGNGSPYGFSVIENTLYFSATQSATGKEFWKSDGTAAGTVLVKDLNTFGNRGSAPRDFTLINGTIFFVALDSLLKSGLWEINSLLWKTDGTEAGTVFIKSWPGSLFYGSGGGLTDLNEVFYFSANGPVVLDRELWKSDGTEAGTVKFDLYPGDQSSYPSYLTVLNNQLLFAADDLLLGRELWSLSYGPLPLSLLGFSARNVNSKIELSWQTTNEINTALFEIERSAKSEFTKIGEVAAINQAGKHYYRLYDEQPLQGSNFYRLKMIDIDGDFTYSTITRVDFNSIGHVRLSPNPAGNELKISHVGGYDLLQVIDAAGRVVYQQKISDGQVLANIQTLVPGNYVLRLTGKNVQKTLQFIKQ